MFYRALNPTEDRMRSLMLAAMTRGDEHAAYQWAVLLFKHAAVIWIAGSRR